MLTKAWKVLRALRWLTAACLAWAATGSTAARGAERIVAFPGAEGAGKYTVGGRFGSVYRVTNLNASGPGSLADAVSQPNRIVVFSVSGIIDLSGGDKSGDKVKGRQIHVNQPHITIAGQTAPGEGICLKGGTLDVRASDVIVRYLRSRRGWGTQGDMGDAFTAKPGKSGVQAAPINESQADFDRRKLKKHERGKDVYEHGEMQDIIFDHLSASWATDENNTDPQGGATPIVYVAARVSRARAASDQAGVWRVTRTGGTATPLEVFYSMTGTAPPERDATPRASSVIIPAGAAWADIRLSPTATALPASETTVVLSLSIGQAAYHVGCPCASLVVIVAGGPSR